MTWDNVRAQFTRERNATARNRPKIRRGVTLGVLNSGRMLNDG
jgi:hypothetical protein